MPSTHVSLNYHIIFSTKHREPLLGTWRPRLYDYLGGCFRQAGGVAIDIGGVEDHVHIYAGLRATHCIADVLRDIKKASSSWIHETMGLPRFAWQEGYGAFTVDGRSAEGLIRYIRDQNEHHRHHTFADEYRSLLERYGINYDERFLW